jgi:hypothetical protein
MPDPKRIEQLYRDIHRLRTEYYTRHVRASGQEEAPTLTIDVPWQELPEPGKLLLLQNAIDWSGIGSRVQGRILLSELDPGKLSDAQRQHLMAMAKVEPDVFERHGHRSAQETTSSTDKKQAADKQPEPPRRPR